MTTRIGSLDRRTLLRGALATAAIAPLAAACGSPSGSEGNGGPAGEVTADNPFGVADGTEVDAVIFDGGYSTDYVDFAGEVMSEQIDGVTFKVSPATDIGPELQPRFAGGNPPDLIDNSGEDQIGFTTIMDQIEDLDDVFDAENYEGTVIRETLYPGVEAPGTFNERFVAINYVMTVYAVWYSASLFEANGWTPPKTWDEAIDLGQKAKAKNKYLFVHGTEAATYYRTMMFESAIKEGGDEVRLALENLEPDVYSNPAVQDVIKALETMVKEGMFVPGGSGTQFTAAQAKWSNDQQALLYPSGGWIENEMKDATKADFQMTGFPTPTVTDNPGLPYETLQAAAGEPFIVPSKAKSPEGGKELLRAMLSKEAAENFSKTRLAPTIVKGTVAEDGYGSTALKSQTDLLEAAGDNVFQIQHVNYYGLNTDQLVVWNDFLSGKADAAGLTSRLQEINDKAAADDSIDKLVVE